MNTNLLSVLTPPSIYNGCSTLNTFWKENLKGEENFTLGEFSAVNMKKCGCQNIGKHRDIKGSYDNATLDILLKFGSLYKIRITSSYPNYNFGRSGKGLITSMGLKAKARPNKYKKARHSIGKVSMKDLSKIIREF